MKYHPQCTSPNCDNDNNGLPCSSNNCKKQLVHQPSCQMFRYPKVPLPPPFKISNCNYENN